MGSLSKTDIAGAEVEGGLARTLGATVGLVGVINLQEPVLASMRQLAQNRHS